MIPEGAKVGFDDCLKPGQDLQTAYDDPASIGQDSQGRAVTTRQLIDMARPLEGLVRQDSIHAAAVVIGDRDLSEYLPLQRKGADEPIVTQYAMGDVDALGLLKMDFLGLRNLDVIDEAVRLVRESSRHRARPGAAAARRQEDVRAAGEGRRDRRVPVRVERHARRAAAGEADRVRRHHRPRGAVPAGADAEHPGLRAAQERQGARLLPRRPAQGHPLAHVRRDGVPGAEHADREVAGRVLARRGRRPAQGDRQEERRADGVAEGPVHRGLRRERRPGPRRSCCGARTSAPPTTRSTSRTPPATR